MDRSSDEPARSVMAFHEWALTQLDRLGRPSNRSAVARAIGEDPGNWWHYMRGDRTPALPKLVTWCREWNKVHPEAPAELSITFRGLEVGIDWDTLDDRL